MLMMRNIFRDLHTAACQKVLIPVAEKQWLLRPSRFCTAMTHASGMSFRRRSEAWGDEEKKAYVLNRLRAVLRHAQRHTTYYSQVFARVGFDTDADFSFDDFARLPVLLREHVITDELALIATDIQPSRLRAELTGGSTGKPVRVWLGPREMGWRDSGADYYHRRVGVLPGKRTALLWGHHLDPVRSSSLKDRILVFTHNIRWFDCFRLSPEILSQYHEQMQAWRPDFIIAYASALACLAEHVLSHGWPRAYPQVCCITGAEKLLPQQRRLAEAAFGKVYERYGCRDVGLLAFQLDCTSTDLEIDWANVLVEPETSEPESAVLVTKLNADGMPMIRYRLGDVASFPSGSQPGHPAFRLQGVLGRAADRLFLPSGKWINGLQLPHLMKDYPVREFLFVQRRDYSLDLQIAPSKGFGEQHRRSIETIVGANLPGLPLRIAIVQQVQRAAASKLRPVISEVAVAPENSHK